MYQKPGYVTISTYGTAHVASSVLSTFMPMLSPLIITPTLWHKTEPYFPTGKTAARKGYLAPGTLFKKRWVQNLNSKIWIQSLILLTGPLHVPYHWLKQMVKSWPSSLEQVQMWDLIFWLINSNSYYQTGQLHGLSLPTRWRCTLNSLSNEE